MFLARRCSSNPNTYRTAYSIGRGVTTQFRCHYSDQTKSSSGTFGSDSTKKKEAVVIPAANSKVTQGIIPMALKLGKDIIALTGSVSKSQQIYRKYAHDPRFQIVGIKHEDYADPHFVEAVIKTATHGKTYDHVGVINTLGGTRSSVGTPDQEEVLVYKNITQPVGFINGTLEGLEGRVGEIGVVNISSIAASISDRGRCTYARVRGEGEEAVTNTVEGSRVRTLTQLRVGLVQPRMYFDEETGKFVLDSGHNHSAEHWRDYPFITVGGKDDQPLQQPVGLDCVAKGALAAASRDFGPDHWVVNGVSKQKMTQREYLTYFTKDKRVLCVHVPLEVLHAMTKIVADGRLQPYAIFILEALEKNPELLDTEDFELLLGSSAETLDDMYSEHRTTTFSHSGPQLLRYITQFLKTSFKNPRDAAEFAKTVMFARGWGLSVVDRA